MWTVSVCVNMASCTAKTVRCIISLLVYITCTDLCLVNDNCLGLTSVVAVSLNNLASEGGGKRDVVRLRSGRHVYNVCTEDEQAGNAVDFRSLTERSDVLFTGKIISHSAYNKSVFIRVKRMLKGGIRDRLELLRNSSSSVIQMLPADGRDSRNCLTVLEVFGTGRKLSLHRTAIFAGMKVASADGGVYKLITDPIVLNLRNLDSLNAAVRGEYQF